MLPWYVLLGFEDEKSVIVFMNQGEIAIYSLEDL